MQLMPANSFRKVQRESHQARGNKRYVYKKVLIENRAGK